jgi:hypothetical protein
MTSKSEIKETINQVKLDNIPEELKSYPQWVAWKAVPQSDSKFTKVPVNPKTGNNAATNNPGTWGTFEEASEHYVWNKENGIDGIGFVFSKDDPFCGIDLDDCRDPETGEIKQWAKDLLQDLNSYCEISPSNTGVKVFLKGALTGNGRNFGTVEMYDTGRFFTLTGETFNGYPKTLEERGAEIARLYDKLNSEKQQKGSSVIEVQREPGVINVDALPINYGTRKLIKEGEAPGKRSEAIMSAINSLVKASVSEDEIFSVFEQYPIGEKYREKGASKRQWLKNHIDKANNFVTAKQDDADDSEASQLFPFPVMSGAAGYFANLYGSVLEAPREFLFMSYLTCLGSVLSRRLTLASEVAPQPRLYTVLLGQSADERKSTALNKTTELFREALSDFEVCWGVGSAEGLQRRLEEASHGLMLCLDEFKLFVSKCQITSSVLLPCVNTLFEKNKYESRTKTTNIILEDAHLSILAASTVQTWERSWDAAFTDIGFNNRLFLVPGTAKRKFSLPSKISGRDKLSLKDDLLTVVKHVGRFLELELTPSAMGLYHNWYMNMERSIHAKRLEVYAMRLMSLLAANDLKSEVDAETVKKVTALCDWQLEIRKTHDPIDADNKVAAMEERIRRALRKGQKKERRLQQVVNARRTGLWVYEMARKNLERYNEIVFNKTSKKWKLLS